MRSANKNRRSPPTQNNLAASSPRSNEQPTRVSAASASVASQSTTITSANFFQGPIPPPELLVAYESICPGSADKILARFETQSDHRMRLERTVITLSVLEKIRTTIKKNKACSAYRLIAQLNPIIRGWCNYHRHVCSKKIFDVIDTAVFRCLWRWAKRRHQNKNQGWITDKYFGYLGNRNWRFFGEDRPVKGEPLRKAWLLLAARTPIVRHTKIRKGVNPYEPAYDVYLAQRKERIKLANRADSARGYGRIDDENDWFTSVPGIVTTTALRSTKLSV